MARTLTVNYAEVYGNNVITNPDYSVTVVARYVVGYKDGSGNITYLSSNTFLGAALGRQVLVTAAPTDSHEATATAVETAIAAQENLNLATGDTIKLL